MSGGFFRGTSADQDTRFSNKQAKLLKSQKFAPELENLVDMTKVKIDVMKPWIAKRVTELIGFEDEVVINFIYGLLEGKGVNGKQVQISLTGFMERNTGKFMKELWVLLLSAQQNASGVPQQFLDAKEEETRKKKAETDRIADEIQRKNEKERQEADKEKTKMDGHGAMSGDEHTESELNMKPGTKSSGIQRADEREIYKRNGPRRHNRDSRSPDSSYHSQSPRKNHSVSPSKSSNRSDSGRRPRSISDTPLSRSRSISSDRLLRPSPRRSMTPRRRHIIQRLPSPRRRSLHSNRRSTSPSRRRSPPARYRMHSPLRYRSRSPSRRRSRTPIRRRSRTPPRRSPVRYRSRSPLRHRSPSPARHRSPPHVRGRPPSPRRGGSPSTFRRRSPSPLRRRPPSPVGRRSPSPRRGSRSPARRWYRRSPSTPQPRSISPVRRRPTMQGRKGSFSPVNRRSPSPGLSSPSLDCRIPPSSVRKSSRKSTRPPTHSPEDGDRSHGKYTPARHASPNERIEVPAKNRNGSIAGESKPVVSLRSPQRNMMELSDSRPKERELSPSMQKSPSVSDASGDRCIGGEQRPASPIVSPHQKVVRPERSGSFLTTAAPKPHRDSSGMSVDDKENFSSRELGKQKYRSSSKLSPTPVCLKDSLGSSEICGLGDSKKLRKTQLLISDRLDHQEHHARRELSTTHKTTDLSEKERKSHVNAGDRTKDKNSGQSDDNRGCYQLPELEALPKLSRKYEQNDKNGSLDSTSKEINEQIEAREKRKHKKLNRRELESDDYSSYDSYEERKEAKRRRKEEKRMKKEERRRRREERRRKRDERRAEKVKLKSVDSGSSSDHGQDHSEDDSVRRLDSRPSNIPETESEQRKLEIELREKALESLRAKKSLGN